MAAKKGKGVNDAAVQRLNVRIGISAYQRLMITSVMSKRAPGDIVAELIERNLREYRVQRNPITNDGSHDRVDSSPQISGNAAA